MGVTEQQKANVQTPPPVVAWHTLSIDDALATLATRATGIDAQLGPLARVMHRTGGM